MQLLHDLVLVLLLGSACRNLRTIGLINRLSSRLLAEPRVKVGNIAEDVWQQEVEERPELVQVVLERGPGDEQTSSRVEQANDLGEDRVDILDSVRLVNDDVFP